MLLDYYESLLPCYATHCIMLRELPTELENYTLNEIPERLFGSAFLWTGTSRPELKKGFRVWILAN